MEVLTSDIYGGGTKFDCSQIVGGMTNIDSTVDSLYPVHRYMVCDYRIYKFSVPIKYKCTIIVHKDCIRNGCIHKCRPL